MNFIFNQRKNLDCYDQLEDLDEFEEWDDQGEQDELDDLLSELKDLQGLMYDFHLIPPQHRPHLDLMEKNTRRSRIATENTALTLETIPTKKNRLAESVIIIGGCCIGSLGFIVNPVIGVGTLCIGSGLGFLVTKMVK